MTKTPIILPSETQSREFDAKLLLAQRLAAQGHPVFVGSRMEIHKQIHRLPRGLYLAKDLNKSSTRILNILTCLGFAIAAWDEEAVSIADIPTFQSRRIGPGNLALARGIFAWGEQNREAVATHADYTDQPIWITGNPRTDLLRPALRGYFDAEVAPLRAQFGDFILINSNFGRLNHFLPQERARQAADGTWINVAQGTPEWWTYRRAVMDSFIALLPILAARYPDRQIVVRPHPSESASLWKDLTIDHQNVTVLHDGAVHPWILASAVAIHNMCTTGIESHLLGHEVIAYEAVPADGQRTSLANELSRATTSPDSLFTMLDAILSGTAPAFQPSKTALAQLEHEMGPQTGPLAADRIAGIVTREIDGWVAAAQTGRRDVALGTWQSRRRKFSKQINSLRPNHKNSAAYTRSRWPGLTTSEVSTRLARLAALASAPQTTAISSPFPQIFRLAPTAEERANGER
ncbi:MAG: surface carbohydrate biosynthesis protein [Pseudomonadota bacterium]